MRNPGQYRWPIVIRSFNNTNDGQGGATTSTTPLVVNTWAKVEEIDANSLQQFGETSASVGYELTIRWRDDLNEATGGVMTRSYEIVWNGLVLNINGVRDSLNKGLWETIITASRKS
jgi:SPP1 family predicted phage head-tail adaptor